MSPTRGTLGTVNCNVFRTNLGTLLDMRLDEYEVTMAEAHVRRCAECRELLESRLLLRSIVKRSNADETLPAFVAERIAATKPS